MLEAFQDSWANTVLLRTPWVFLSHFLLTRSVHSVSIRTWNVFAVIPTPFVLFSEALTKDWKAIKFSTGPHLPETHRWKTAEERSDAMNYQDGYERKVLKIKKSTNLMTTGGCWRWMRRWSWGGLISRYSSRGISKCGCGRRMMTSGCGWRMNRCGWGGWVRSCKRG